MNLRRHMLAVVGLLATSCVTSSSGNGSGGASSSCFTSSDCGAGLVCSSSVSQCVVANGHSYVVTLIGASVPTKDVTGAAWDSGGGAPDPKVYVKLNGSTVGSTSEDSDTFTPSWYESFVVTLRDGDTLTFSLYDIDALSDDFIDSLQFSDWLSEVKAGPDRTAFLYDGAVSLQWRIVPD